MARIIIGYSDAKNQAAQAQRKAQALTHTRLLRSVKASAWRDAQRAHEDAREMARSAHEWRKANRHYHAAQECARKARHYAWPEPPKGELF